MNWRLAATNEADSTLHEGTDIEVVSDCNKSVVSKSSHPLESEVRPTHILRSRL